MLSQHCCWHNPELLHVYWQRGREKVNGMQSRFTPTTCLCIFVVSPQQAIVPPVRPQFGSPPLPQQEVFPSGVELRWCLEAQGAEARAPREPVCSLSPKSASLRRVVGSGRKSWSAWKAALGETGKKKRVGKKKNNLDHMCPRIFVEIAFF